MKTSPVLWTWLAAGSLILFAAIGLLSHPVPSLLCPKPALLFIPSLFLGKQKAIAILLPPLLFLLWNKDLVNGARRIPKRTYILTAFCLILMPLEFTSFWEAGILEQGQVYTYTVCIVNAAFGVLLIIALAVFRNKRATFAANLITHWLLFVWLSWYAFPALGRQI